MKKKDKIKYFLTITCFASPTKNIFYPTQKKWTVNIAVN